MLLYKNGSSVVIHVLYGFILGYVFSKQTHVEKIFFTVLAGTPGVESKF
jgi:hypothetical protein